ALPLNILAHNKNKPSITHKYTNRSLCECELYAPAKYDNDPQMKSVMKDFDSQTSQRLEEYNERMIRNRQKCKDRCDKEIQKIILKDKIDKELTEKFATLQKDIQSDAIPTCICEKSIADKVEKVCLKCTQNLGGIVAPSSGVLAGIAEGALYAWKPTALEAAIAAAEKAGALAGEAAGLKEGMNTVIRALTHYGVHNFWPDMSKSIGKTIPYNDVGQISKTIVTKYEAICGPTPGVHSTCLEFDSFLVVSEEGEIPLQYANPSTVIPKFMNTFVESAKGPAEKKAAEATVTKTAELQETYKAAVESTYGSFQTTITASIIAIVIIILVMVIIYKILRYRQKKKMKKKLQYIKLLEE
ncbi:rifin, partial [Plasmodium reichenowi]